MESLLDENFGAVAKLSSERALQRWRNLCGVVKNPKRRFRFTAKLSNRVEAAAIHHANEEMFRVAVLVSQAAFQFIHAAGVDPSDYVVPEEVKAAGFDISELQTSFEFGSSDSFLPLHPTFRTDDPPPPMPDDRERKDGWSSLPIDLLWMIKDRLNIIDNMRLTAVCRVWCSASKYYPKRLQSVGEGPPWIFKESSGYKSSSRDFIDVATKDKFSISLPEFQDASVLFSQHGWFLLQKRIILEPNKSFLFLIQPFTRSKILLPDVVDLLPGGSSKGHDLAGSFSTRESYPHCVVLLKFVNPTQVSISITYPGHQEWIDHTYMGQRYVYAGYSNLITMGNHVYSFDVYGRMIIYDMCSNSWKELDGSDEILKAYVTEHDGGILKIVQHGDNFTSFELFRYNDADTAWENVNTLMDTSWFLRRSHNCFSAKGKGLKVYFLFPKPDFGCLVHDLETGTTKTLHFQYPVRVSATWVHIG